MTFEEEFEIIRNNLLEALEKESKRETISMLDTEDRTWKQAKMEYNEKLLELKKKYHID
ncbi:MAG: hypothetical protein ACRDA4_10095 [Filifactoraceae bacterium]